MEKVENVTGLGERLRKLIDDTGLNHAQFAQKAGLTRATLSNYLNGNSEPRLATLVYLSKILNTNPNYLLGVTNSQFSKTDASAAGNTHADEKKPETDSTIVEAVEQLENRAAANERAIADLARRIALLEGSGQ